MIRLPNAGGVRARSARLGSSSTWRHIIVLALLAVGIASCGSSGGDAAVSPTNTGTGTGTGGTTTSSNSNEIDVVDNEYDPASVTVATGTTVTWTWHASYSTHSVTFDDGPTSPTQLTGSYSRTFSAAGTYTYHCLIHGQAMSGTVVVQ